MHPVDGFNLPIPQENGRLVEWGRRAFLPVNRAFEDLPRTLVAEACCRNLELMSGMGGKRTSLRSEPTLGFRVLPTQQGAFKWATTRQRRAGKIASA
jgi:hypothetical protein